MATGYKEAAPGCIIADLAHILAVQVFHGGRAHARLRLLLSCSVAEHHLLARQNRCCFIATCISTLNCFILYVRTSSELLHEAVKDRHYNPYSWNQMERK